MDSDALDRRRFHQLTAAALGGMITGATLGCGGDGGNDEPAAVAEKHLCRGLNTCQGKGAGGDNACAGQGACATVEHHSCGGQNTCAGLGGCGEEVGQNSCKGEGGCQVPLMESAWETMRTRFEANMQEQGKEFGEPPPKPAD